MGTFLRFGPILVEYNHSSATTNKVVVLGLPQYQFQDYRINYYVSNTQNSTSF